MEAWFRNCFSAPIVFVNLVPQGADRNPEQLRGVSAAATLICQRFDNELALDLSNPAPDKAPDGFDLICGKFQQT
jgi:hypothetical protein